jgi:hypothetical protein
MASKKRNAAFPFMMDARDFKLKPGKRRLFAERHAMPFNTPAAFIRTKGFSGLSLRRERSYPRGLTEALQSARKAMHKRCWNEHFWRDGWEVWPPESYIIETAETQALSTF